MVQEGEFCVMWILHNFLNKIVFNFKKFIVASMTHWRKSNYLNVGLKASKTWRRPLHSDTGYSLTASASLQPPRLSSCRSSCLGPLPTCLPASHLNPAHSQGPRHSCFVKHHGVQLDTPAPACPGDSEPQRAGRALPRPSVTTAPGMVPCAW